MHSCETQFSPPLTFGLLGGIEPGTGGGVAGGVGVGEVGEVGVGEGGPDPPDQGLTQQRPQQVQVTQSHDCQKERRREIKKMKNAGFLMQTQCC